MNATPTAVNLVIAKVPPVNASVVPGSREITAIPALQDIMDSLNVVCVLVIVPELIQKHAPVMVACVIIKDNAIAR